MSTSGPYLAEIASLMGDPARANILHALMDGRALTAKELAFLAGVAPQTASGHLARLLQGGLVAVAAQGRHRYYRLAGAEVAQALEGLMVLAAAGPAARKLPHRVGADLSQARTCYDHFAGRLGTDIHDALMAGGHLVVAEGGYGLTRRARASSPRSGSPFRPGRRAVRFCAPASTGASAGRISRAISPPPWPAAASKRLGSCAARTAAP